MRNNNKKIMLLIAVTLLISMLYLFVGIDFEIFEYQFSIASLFILNSIGMGY